MKRFLSVLLLFTFCNLQGQSFSLLHWTTEEGLPSNTVYDIEEMPDGTIVLGTDNGLSFFDGTKFKSYFTTSGLLSNFIIALDIDKDSTLYVGNYKDSVQTLKNGRFKTLPIHGQTINGLVVLDTAIVTQIGARATGYLLNSYFFDAKTFKLKWSKYCYFGKVIQDMPYTKKNYSILKYKNKTLQLEGNRLTIDNKTGVLNSGFEAIIGLDASEDYLALLGNNYVYITDWQLNLKKKIALPTPPRYENRQVCLDKNGGLWFNEQKNGLYYCRIETGLFRNVSSDDLGLHSNENIDKVFCDSKKRIWIATYDHGLFCIPNVSVRQYNNESSNFINSVIFAKGKIWASSRSNVFSVENKVKKEELQTKTEIFDASILNNTLWFMGSLQPYVLTKYKDFNLSTMRRMIYSNDSIVVFTSFENQYWVLKLDSLSRFFDILYANTSKYWKPFYVNNSTISQKLRSLDIYKGKYYLNAGYRLRLCQIKGDELIDAGTPEFWKENWHTTDLKSYKNKLYISTDASVYVVEDNNIKETISEINGVKFGVINKIKIRKDVLWVLTSNGLFKRPLVSGQPPLIFNQYNVLKSPEVEAIDFDDKGTLFVATRRGVTEIPVDLYSKNTEKPMIGIESYSVDNDNNKIIRIESEQIILKNDQSYIRFHLNIRNFNASKNRQIQYRIDGGSVWNNALETAIDIPLVSYGKHLIEFRVRDVNSDWTQLSIELIREWPFYYRTDFILICVLLLLLVSWLYYSHLLKKQQKRQQAVLETNNRISELRQSALATMMNPHFLFNALNAIQYFINSNQKEKSSGYLAKLSRLVRKFLNHASEPYITLQEELERLSIYVELELLRFNNGFKFIQDIQVELPTESINLPNMILQPFIENAIIHGISRYEEGGFVKLSVHQQHKQLTITIEDNGPGIDLNAVNINKKHASKAIGIIKERLQILQKMYPKDIFKIEEGFVDSSATERKGHRVVILLTIK